MNKLALSLALAFALHGAAMAGSPPAVNAEQMDLDADLNAKIGKEKAKKSGTSARNAKEGLGDGDGGGSKGSCGQVNINSNDKKSNSGIKDMFGKQTTTIVTGPVINMASCK